MLCRCGGQIFFGLKVTFLNLLYLDMRDKKELGDFLFDIYFFYGRQLI